MHIGSGNPEKSNGRIEPASGTLQISGLLERDEWEKEGVFTGEAVVQQGWQWVEEVDEGQDFVVEDVGSIDEEQQVDNKLHIDEVEDNRVVGRVELIFLWVMDRSMRGIYFKN